MNSYYKQTLRALAVCLGVFPGLGSCQVSAQSAIGQGPGFHDPRSAVKPLQERDGIVSWQLLSSVTIRAEKDKLTPEFSKPLQALNNQTVKIQGFMLPLEPGDKQRHFLLSAVPTSCSFCVPAGPEGLVEVKSRTPVKYTLEPQRWEFWQGRVSRLHDRLVYTQQDGGEWLKERLAP